MNTFDELSKERKLELVIGLYNLMVRYNRYYGWVVYMDNDFLFFDSEPNYPLSDDCFDATTDDLLDWMEDLK
jgi:hypothetical protein